MHTKSDIIVIMIGSDTNDVVNELISSFHCNIVNNDYQHDSRVLYTFVPNKPFGSLLEISPTNHIFLKTFNSEYDEIKVWFTDQNSQPLEIEDNKFNISN